MSFVYFIRCQRCGYPLAREVYATRGEVADRHCPNCGFWEYLPNSQEAAEWGVDPSSVDPNAHKGCEPLVCTRCKSDMVVVDDYYRGETPYHYRLTLFCPKCWFYRRYSMETGQAETQNMPSVPPESASTDRLDRFHAVELGLPARLPPPGSIVL